MSHHHLTERELLELILVQEADIDLRLIRIERILNQEIRSFAVHQFIPAALNQFGGFPMAILGIIPGSTGVFTATPLNAAGEPVTAPLAAPPVWTSSDPLAVVTANPDGLGASVAVDASAPQGGSFTLTVAMADGSAATPVTVPYDQKPVDNTVASFGVTQTA